MRPDHSDQYHGSKALTYFSFRWPVRFEESRGLDKDCFTAAKGYRADQEYRLQNQHAPSPPIAVKIGLMLIRTGRRSSSPA